MLTQKMRGFTIVELLIVIVVIGILASITIVAYNGVSDRAENIKTIAAVKNYADAIEVFATNTGDYPSASIACLRPDSGTCGVNSPNYCAYGLGAGSTNTTFSNNLKTVTSNLPELSSQSVTCNASGAKFTGGFYYRANATTIYLIYVLKGDQPCVAPGDMTLVPTANPWENATICYTLFPQLG